MAARRPLVSYICPTIGRRTLRRWLESVRDQAGPEECEIIVVGDTYNHDFTEALKPVRYLCTEFQAAYHEYDGGLHCVGHPQRQYGATVAKGQWLMWSQDDNVLRPGAWAVIQEALTTGPRLPHLFRVRSRFQSTVWHTEGDLSVGAIDADCIAAPNVRGKIGVWKLVYEGDQAFIVDTVGRWKGHAVWNPTVIMDSRPGGIL